MPAHVKVRRLAWGMLAACGALIFWAALQPDLAPPGEFHADKFIHAAAFTMLGGLAALTSAKRTSLLLWFVALVALGAGIELAQAMVPGREMSISDLLSDTIGVLAGMSTRRYAMAMGTAILLRLSGLEGTETP